MEKPKIAVLGIKYLPSIGGTSRVAENLINTLKQDFHFTLYCYKHPAAQNTIQGIKVIQIPKIPFGTLGVFIYYLICALHARWFLKYDLAHIHKTDATFMVHLLPKNKPIINTSHEAPYLRDKWSAISRLYFKQMETTFINSRALKTCISKPLTDHYNKIGNSIVHYIPNGVDLSRKYDFSMADRLLAKHDITPNFLFFAARRIMRTKGAHTMLKALNKSRYKGDIVIAGDTTQMPEYLKTMKHLSSGLSVKYIGFVEKIETLLALISKSKYFIFPSETEGMSIMLMEVSGVGTPIIASNIKENTTIFSNEELLFFKNKNHVDLADKLSWAFDNEAIMQQKARNAKRKVEETYTWASISPNYKTLYHNLTNN